MKKKWEKPQLRVLVKGEAEEAVLGSCKNHYAIFENGPESAKCTTIWGILCSQNTSS